MAQERTQKSVDTVPVMIRVPKPLHTKLVKAASRDRRKTGPQVLVYIEQALQAESA